MWLPYIRKKHKIHNRSIQTLAMEYLKWINPYHLLKYCSAPKTTQKICISWCWEDQQSTILEKLYCQKCKAKQNWIRAEHFYFCFFCLFFYFLWLLLKSRFWSYVPNRFWDSSNICKFSLCKVSFLYLRYLICEVTRIQTLLY